MPSEASIFWPVSATIVAETGQTRGARGALPLALPTFQTVSQAEEYRYFEGLRRSNSLTLMLALPVL
jgi:hypothetical protein